MKRTHKYDDIIHLPHHESVKRTRMSNYDRAAQFSPFAALTGYEAVIDETARLTDSKIELDEGGKALLDEKLQALRETVDTHPEVRLTCFQADGRKQGGAYVTITGRVKKIDEFRGAVVLTDGTSVPLDTVYRIETDCLSGGEML